MFHNLKYPLCLVLPMISGLQDGNVCPLKFILHHKRIALPQDLAVLEATNIIGKISLTVFIPGMYLACCVFLILLSRLYVFYMRLCWVARCRASGSTIPRSMSAALLFLSIKVVLVNLRRKKRPFTRPLFFLFALVKRHVGAFWLAGIKLSWAPNTVGS